MQRLTGWGALLSPDGEYWWDGRSWRPMYTPDRRHVWNGADWQVDPAAAGTDADSPAGERAATVAPPAPPHPPATGSPSWLPAGVSRHGGPGSTGAHRDTGAAPSPPAPLPARARRGRGRALLVALGTVLILVVGLGIAAGGYLYYQRVTAAGALAGTANPLAGVALQATDLPSTLTRCAGVYFDQHGYLAYLQKNHPDQHQAAVTDWARSQQEGTLDAWYTGYADQPDRCDRLITGSDLGPSARGAMNVVFLTRDVASAGKAVKDSFGSVPAFITPQRGAATGLGDNSLSAYTEAGSFKTYLAIWQTGRHAALLSVTGLNQDQSERAARAVNLRMR